MEEKDIILLQLENEKLKKRLILMENENDQLNTAKDTMEKMKILEEEYSINNQTCKERMKELDTLIKNIKLIEAKLLADIEKSQV